MADGRQYVTEIDELNGRMTFSTITIEPRTLYIGTPVVLISTTNPNGTPNLAPMSSAWYVGGSWMLGLDATSQTTLNLRRTGELVLNLPDAGLADHVDRLACTTGTQDLPPHKAAKGFIHVEDKFGHAELTASPSTIVTPPRVAECPIQIESHVKSIHELGGHDSGVVAVEATVSRVHIHPHLLVPGTNHHIDPDTWDPLLMKFCHLYGHATNLRPSQLADAWQIPPVTARTESDEPCSGPH
jgi:flavin reductase (DIM6/NTAB) family NADH-FMN oxidoreductase RutF